MWESLRTVRVYLWRYRGGLALGLGALVLKDVAGAVQPLVIRAAIDALAHAFGLVRLLRYAGYLVGLAVVKGLFQYWMRVIIIGISRDIEYDLRNDLFRHLAELSPDYYGRMRTGDIMARATNDLNAVRMMLGPGIMYWTETSLTFLLAIVIMVAVDWRLALLAVLPAPLVSLARAFVKEQAELRHFEELNRAYIAENVRLVRISAVFQPLLEALIGITFLVVLWYGGGQVLTGRISLGSFVMFNTYMGILVWPMIALGWVVNLMQRGGASLERINQIFHEKPTIAAPPHPVRLARVRGEIEFRNASVAYPSGRALDNASLTIEAGATVAVVGHTGSGKSTLAGLVPRLMDPTEGRVLLDGIDLRDLSPAELRRHIGFVPQETFLFSATIAGNIAFGVESATEEDIRRAAELAGLAADIESFPKGYETMVGERGITLSGGQKQRTAIARAILRNPRILILDDA